MGFGQWQELAPREVSVNTPCLLTHRPPRSVPPFVLPLIEPSTHAHAHWWAHGEMVCSADDRQGLIKGETSKQPFQLHRGLLILSGGGEEIEGSEGYKALMIQQSRASGH